MNCDARFTFTKRRHHCRACGKVSGMLCPLKKSILKLNCPSLCLYVCPSSYRVSLLLMVDRNSVKFYRNLEVHVSDQYRVSYKDSFPFHMLKSQSALRGQSSLIWALTIEWLKCRGYWQGVSVGGTDILDRFLAIFTMGDKFHISCWFSLKQSLFRREFTLRQRIFSRRPNAFLLE